MSTACSMLGAGKLRKVCTAEMLGGTASSSSKPSACTVTFAAALSPRVTAVTPTSAVIGQAVKLSLQPPTTAPLNLSLLHIALWSPPAPSISAAHPSTAQQQRKAPLIVPHFWPASSPEFAVLPQCKLLEQENAQQGVKCTVPSGVMAGAYRVIAWLVGNGPALGQPVLGVAASVSAVSPLKGEGHRSDG